MGRFLLHAKSAFPTSLWVMEEVNRVWNKRLTMPKAPARGDRRGCKATGRLVRRTMARMSFCPRAITLDLDDTLWPIIPVIERAEATLHDWLCEHAPQAAARFPVAAMRALRDRIARDNPQLSHDYSSQRLLSLRHALADSGHDPAHAERAYEVFFAARNDVQPYPEVMAALARISARVPLAALTNGNADLSRTVLATHFRFQLGAREHGAAKPAASIFLAACERLGHAPADVLHVGDDPQLDVVGAQRAGLRTCWINRRSTPWPSAHPDPHLTFVNLAALADWLEHTLPSRSAS